MYWLFWETFFINIKFRDDVAYFTVVEAQKSPKQKQISSSALLRL